ncbi:MAG: SurA N-terminal domain-containing protein [Deltaproteobacteria bacterium]|nr:SurA N-terminal domain-containing protein [Deltaproteobacteria bacterium]
MLQAIRKRQKFLLTIFIGVISVVFIFWGFYGDLSRRQLRKTDVASVNGEHISVQEFQKQYEYTLRLYQNLLKDKFTPEMAEQFNLKQVTLNQLIDQKLIVQGAQALKLHVSDEEVRDTIIQTVFFQKNGQFDKEHYLNLLKANRLTPTEYENNIRLDLLQGKILTLLKDHIKISDEEVLKNYVLKNEKANLEFVRIDPQAFLPKVTTTPEEVKTFLAVKENLAKAQSYYTANQHLFKEDKPEKLKLFEAVKENIGRTLLQEQKAQELAKTTADQLWKAKDNSSASSKLLKDSALKWEETGLFSRATKYIPKMGDSSEMMQLAFNLNKNAFAPRIITIHTANYIVKLKDRQPADLKSFEKDKDKNIKEALNQKQSEAFYEWLKEIKSKAKISISKFTQDSEE